MTKPGKRFLVGVTLVLSVTLATYAWNSLPNGPRWQRGCPQIAVGDSEQRVLEIMGKPNEIKDCERPRYSGNLELWQKCAEEYWYVTFMQTWGVVIGKDGKVIAKWYNVSP
jgi:hypothetical protein